MRKNCLMKTFPSLERFYFKRLRCLIFIIVGMVLFMMSLLIFLCENMSFIKVDFTNSILKALSINVGEWLCLIIVYIFLLYILHCAYFFVFKFKFWNIYGLKMGNKTNLISLLETSSMFSYFCFPVLINF